MRQQACGADSRVEGEPPRDSRCRLIEAALELIHERSYATVGVAEICGRAGVQKGSFYHHFPSKRDLTLVVLDTLVERARRRIREPAFQETLTPHERVERIFRASLDFFGPEAGESVAGCPFGNLGAELGTIDDVVRRRIQEIFDLMIDYFERALESDHPADGVELASVHRRARARQLLVLFQGAWVLAKTENNPAAVMEGARAAVTMVGPRHDR